MNADGTDQTRLTDHPAIDSDPSFGGEADADGDGVPFFRDNCPTTPNPERIVFTSFRSGNFEIYAMNPDGTSLTNLTNNAANDNGPAFSPDGTKIAFRSNRDGGNSEIYVMNADGTNPTNVTNNAAFDSDPAFSPDSQKIAFVSTRDGDREIYIMNADGTNPTPLTTNVVTDY